MYLLTQTTSTECQIVSSTVWRFCRLQRSKYICYTIQNLIDRLQFYVTQYYFVQFVFLLVCHAELNAVLNKNSADVKDCTIYVALFPCNECAKVIIQSGIREVVYCCDKYAAKPEFIASRKLLNIAGVTCR